MNVSVRLSAIAAAVMLHACGGGSPARPSAAPAVLVTGLERYPTPLTAGLKIQLTATFRSATGTTEDCTSAATWSSSNDAIVRSTGQRAGEFITMTAGEATVSAACAGATGNLPLHVDKATRWPIIGRVLSAPDGPPIADAMLTFGDSAPVTSDASGNYTIVTEDTLSKRLTVSASAYATRETSLRGGDVRLLDIDLIGNDPAFPFALYRMMVRNGYEAPAHIATAPIQRWTSAPNVYIWTRWKDSGLPVANVDWYVAEIRRVIPQLTGDRLTAGAIESGPDDRPSQRGWITVQFDHSGNWGMLGANPGRVQFGADHTCNSYAVIHEFGHAMGYWHSNLVPSVMGGGPGTCTEINLWPPERTVARTMYSRPPGNLDPDRDPAGVVMLTSAAPAPVRVTCDRVLRR